MVHVPCDITHDPYPGIYRVTYTRSSPITHDPWNIDGTTRTGYPSQHPSVPFPWNSTGLVSREMAPHAAAIYTYIHTTNCWDKHRDNIPESIPCDTWPVEH